MKTVMALLGAFVLAGCTAQSQEDVRVWSTTNTSTPVAEDIPVGERGPLTHRISIHANNAGFHDVVRKVAEHENLTVRFDANVGLGSCTVDLTDVEPLSALEDIADMHDCVVVQTNNMLIVSGKAK